MRSAFLGLLTALVIVIIGFYSHFWSWGLLLATDAYLIVNLLGLKKWYNNYDFEAISDGMSDSNRDYLRRYGYYFIWTQTCAGRCASSGYKQVAGVVLSVIHAYQFNWWIVIFGLIHYALMGYVGNEYDPTAKFSRNPYMLYEHETVQRLIDNLPPRG